MNQVEHHPMQQQWQQLINFYLMPLLDLEIHLNKRERENKNLYEIINSLKHVYHQLMALINQHYWLMYFA